MPKYCTKGMMLCPDSSPLSSLWNKSLKLLGKVQQILLSYRVSGDVLFIVLVYLKEEKGTIPLPLRVNKN